MNTDCEYYNLILAYQISAVLPVGTFGIAVQANAVRWWNLIFLYKAKNPEEQPRGKTCGIFFMVTVTLMSVFCILRIVAATSIPCVWFNEFVNIMLSVM